MVDRKTGAYSDDELAGLRAIAAHADPATPVPRLLATIARDRARAEATEAGIASLEKMTLSEIESRVRWVNRANELANERNLLRDTLAALRAAASNYQMLVESDLLRQMNTAMIEAGATLSALVAPPGEDDDDGR